MTLHKTVAADAHVRPEGVVEALVATWDVDRVKDRIRPGAFAKSLDAWRRSGKRIPLVWSHETKNPSMVIGSADPHASRETDRGLLLSGKLNIDNSAAAHDVYDLLRTGTINDWSFGYTVQKQQRADGGITDLIEIDLLEAGPCVAGANRMARTVSVKGEAPDRREPEQLTHTQLENLLRREGILARVVPDFHEDEIDQMHGAYRRRRDGGGEDAAEHKAMMLALLTEGMRRLPYAATKSSPAPIQIASFPTD
jgi:uncharacterized protein